LSSDWGYGGFRFTGLYEIHKPFPDVTGLDWFYGIGAHVGSYNGHYYGYDNHNNGYWDNHGNWHPNTYHYTTLGLDLILGLEYQFNEVPFTIGLDIKPYLDLIGRGEHFADGAITLRYIIK